MRKVKIKAVFFDIGETLINEGRIYGAWADWLGVPRHTFLAVLGGVIARGEPHMNVFEHFRPGFDLVAEEAARAAAGVPNGFGEEDLYPDARRCLAALRRAGYVVGVAGNQPREAAARFAALGLESDIAAMSAEWGVEKPSPAFFTRLCEEASLPASEILYVGDRVDNDVVPAAAHGLQTAFLLRGPWAYVQALAPLPVTPTYTIPDLDALVTLLT
ncbi:HAD family hydrolase [Actinocorallia sp. A-T 12471]|uniref:HAD family hydrolase n=1 Tax=Actinocorallia sp. A-T 12471 TaxID=3089813 RepID=UPI0029D1435E|nr:HAD family hydrolase [Actinocorallia sp. A-T 12471]MDX6743783.1 HAD family hydrolase [Actinocorallia sp. A-T 12471]